MRHAKAMPGSSKEFLTFSKCCNVDFAYFFLAPSTNEREFPTTHKDAGRRRREPGRRTLDRLGGTGCADGRTDEAEARTNKRIRRRRATKDEGRGVAVVVAGAQERSAHGR